MSILLTATTSCVTPSERTSKACSLVCPPDSKPDSNEPIVASTTRTATSACGKKTYRKKVIYQKVNILYNYQKLGFFRQQ